MKKNGVTSTELALSERTMELDKVSERLAIFFHGVCVCRGRGQHSVIHDPDTVAATSSPVRARALIRRQWKQINKTVIAWPRYVCCVILFFFWFVGVNSL